MAYSYSDLFKQLGLDKHIKDVDRVAGDLKMLKMEQDKGPSAQKPEKENKER